MAAANASFPMWKATGRLTSTWNVRGVSALALCCLIANFGTGYPAKKELALLADLIARCQDEDDQHGPGIHSLLHSDLGAQLPLHISLSRPVVLRTEQRSSFSEILKKALRDSHISP